MPSVPKLWRLLAHDATGVTRLAEQLAVSPVIAQLLLNRGIKTADAGRRFLDCPLLGLHPPGLLPGINEAANRLARAVEHKTKVCIYGDYDVDGITGTAILFGLLHFLGVPVEFHVPHRLEDGYGVNCEALRQIAANGVKTVVTVDCGITSIREAEEARKLGLELIITDHHEMKDDLPDAAVLVHPRLPGSQYPFGDLSGAGVALKLAWALAQRVSGSEKVPKALREFLVDAVGLAALGLVADVVPLEDENRILVKHGLARLESKPPMGLRALLEAATTPGQVLRSEDVSFKLAPRLNAAGRLGCARLVVEMLTTSSAEKAKEVARFLEEENSKRQTLERKMTSEAKQIAEEQKYGHVPAVVMAQKGWHPGVIGIVAGRMVEHLGRPVLIVALRDDVPISNGSGRSISGFPLHLALKACEADLEGHGGHAMAAGFKILPERIDSFRAHFAAFAAEHFPGGIPPPPSLTLDAEVSLSMMTWGLLRDIDKLEPYGAGNPRPRFLAGNVEVLYPKRMGEGERHLTFRARHGATTMRAVAWGMGDRLDELMAGGGRSSLAFVPRINEWQGYKSIEIEVIDFQPGPEARLV